MPYDIDKIRKQLKQKLSSRPQDPFEFRPPKAKEGEIIKLRFFVLPPLVKGDPVYGGLASRDMELFAIKHGSHWINNRPHPCPRINNDEGCELCEAGFTMLNETEDKDKRAAIVRQWLAQTVYTVNIYFPNFTSNPEGLRGKVMYYHAPKSCFDTWYAAIHRNAPVRTDSDEPDPDPEAYGVFYDERAAFLYQLEISQLGTYNSYKTSKFLASIGPQPIAKNKEGPDEKRIKALLDQRHDLWTKIEDVDPAKIHRMCQQMLHGVDDDDQQLPPTDNDAEVGAGVGAGTTAAEGQEVTAQKPAAATQTAKAPSKPAAATQTAKAPPKPAAQTAVAQTPKAPAKPAPKAATPAPAPAPSPVADELEEELLVEEELEPVASAPRAAPAKPAQGKTEQTKPATSATKAPTKPAQGKTEQPKPATKTQPVIEDDTGDDNIDDLLSKLTPGGTGAAEEEVVVE